MFNQVKVSAFGREVAVHPYKSLELVVPDFMYDINLRNRRSINEMLMSANVHHLFTFVQKDGDWYMMFDHEKLASGSLLNPSSGIRFAAKLSLSAQETISTETSDFGRFWSLYSHHYEEVFEAVIERVSLYDLLTLHTTPTPYVARRAQ